MKPWRLHRFTMSFYVVMSTHPYCRACDGRTQLCLVFCYDFCWLAELVNHTHHMKVEPEILFATVSPMIYIKLYSYKGWWHQTYTINNRCQSHATIPCLTISTKSMLTNVAVVISMLTMWLIISMLKRVPKKLLQKSSYSRFNDSNSPSQPRSTYNNL